MIVDKGNKTLIERYPFLRPRETHSSNFVSTILDDMPAGWRAAFGEDLCKEIMEELVQNNCVDSYQILQVKEKYGELRWYSQGGTERIHHEIIPKYENMSWRICIQCGQTATLISKSWIAPWCVDCAGKMPHIDFVDIEELYRMERND